MPSMPRFWAADVMGELNLGEADERADEGDEATQCDSNRNCQESENVTSSSQRVAISSNRNRQSLEAYHQ